MRVLTLWTAIGIVAILGFMAKPSAANALVAGPALAGVTFGTDPISGIYNYLTINPNGVNTYVVGQSAGLYSGINGSGVAYLVKTTPLAEANGGGFCQVDAIFATVSGGTAYFAVVTDSNPNGVTWDGYGNARFGPGDLNVTAGGNNYGIGARPVDLTTYGQINYGSTDLRSPATMNGTQADVVTNPAAWYHVDNYPLPSPPEPYETPYAYFKGPTTPSVTATASWQQLDIGAITDVGYTQLDTQTNTMQPYSTWVYQVAVPLTKLGLPSNAPLSTITSISFAPDCGNDSVTLFPLIAESNPVPEPVSMIFFGTGLVAIGGYVARRRMLHKA